MSGLGFHVLETSETHNEGHVTRTRLSRRDDGRYVSEEWESDDNRIGVTHKMRYLTDEEIKDMFDDDEPVES